MADIAQFPGAHSQNILPDMTTSGLLSDVISGEKAQLRGY